MRTVRLASGSEVPALGIGAWQIGERPQNRRQEIAAIQCAIDLGMTVIDTAEMYGDGASEELVGEAIQGRRANVFLVSKVLPSHATKQGTIEACERSLRRLRADSLDLYLLHWPGSVPVAETLEAFDQLYRDGKVFSFGVSNFDVGDLEEAWNAPHGDAIVANQILYNLTRRNPEHAVIPKCRDHRVAIMAYSPVEQGRLLGIRKLGRLATKRGITPSQLALAWLLAQPDIIAIPKSGDPRHVEENRVAADLTLTAEDLWELDQAFPRPTVPKTLETL